MKQLTYILSSIVSLIVLLSLQLCLLKYEHSTNCNLLLVAYVYALFAPLSTIITALLILMLDGLNFLMTGYFGYISIILTITSISFVAIKDNFYNKLVMPITGIITYYFCQLMIQHITLQYPAQIPEFIFAITLNSALFVGAWWITNQPMHD